MRVQAVQALACVNEIVAFDKDLLIFEPVQGIADRTRWQSGLADEVFLGQLAARLEHFVHKLCRRGQVPDASCQVIPVCGYDKNDPS